MATGNRLLAFVCEGPTCKDRWESPAAMAALVRALEARGIAERVRVIAEICLGHCRQGANLLSVPVPGPPAEFPRWVRPDSLAPGAILHHGLTIERAAEILAGRLELSDLVVAANHELA